MISAFIFGLGIATGVLASAYYRWLTDDGQKAQSNAVLFTRLMRGETTELPNLNFADWLRLIWFLCQWIYWEWRGATLRENINSRED